MKGNRVWAIGRITLFMGVLLAARLGGQLCDPHEGPSVVGYRGGDASTLPKLNGIVNDTSELVLRLRNKGANFVPSSNYPVTTNYRMTGAAADFNNDGFIDLAEGGRGCDNNSNRQDTNLSLFISKGQDPADPTKFLFGGPFYIDYLSSFKSYEIMSLGAGDYDGDGDNDICALSWRGVCWIFWNRFVEDGLPEGADPVFDPVPTPVLNSVGASDFVNDGYGEFGSGSSHWRWESNIESIDFDGDGDLDLFVAMPTRWATTRYGQVVVLVNDGKGHFSRLITNSKKYINPFPNNSNYIYGVCGIACGDFDGDKKIDFLVGSANSRSIYFYKGDGLGTFTQISSNTLTIPASRGTCTYLRAGDLEGDGDPDVVLATDGHNGNAPGGYVFWYENLANGSFIRHPVPSDGSRVSSSKDLDSGALGDFDGDGDLDFFVADGNDSHNCYFFMNEIYPLYIDHGTVESRNLLPCSFITGDNAIISATLTSSHTLYGGTSIAYYLSNSNDEHGHPKWEGPVTPGVEFFFSEPGDFLRWMADIRSRDERVTPKISWVDLSYKYITRREYSRTSNAVADVEIDSFCEGDEEVLYASSFEFPKWRGHLRAWNVTNLQLAYTRDAELADIVDVGSGFITDAGVLLRDRPAFARSIYTAYDMENDDLMNDRLDFDVSQSAVLDDFLGLGEESPEVEPLIEFVRGKDRAWKLGDINHSSPQAVGPPDGNPARMGTGYEDFKTAYAGRRKVVLAGANDGMLHCFDAQTLEELWAFIPNNLLSKLKKMKIVDPECGAYLSHEFFVDGTPAIQDVYYGGGWHTVLVCGQGAGWGRDGKCYYFALDITEVENPIPLWEYTDIETMGETWSVPAIARIRSIDAWAALFGSGYDTDSSRTLGNSFYALNIATGEVLFKKEIREAEEPASPFGIQNTLPGSPSPADADRDGFHECVYFGDLLGRLWKIDLSGKPNKWIPEVIYADPYRQPIVTKPAVEVTSADQGIHIYFGTGGDEKASSSAYYSFVAVKQGAVVEVEWYLGPEDLAAQLGVSPLLCKGSFSEGDKVWADPVISDQLVYIATLQGNIESINPCLNAEGGGKIYVRHTSGTNRGRTALGGTEGSMIENVGTAQKVRSAATVGKTQRVTEEGKTALQKRKVYVQSFTRLEENPPQPPTEVLAISVKTSKLVIRSWREVYRIVR